MGANNKSVWRQIASWPVDPMLKSYVDRDYMQVLGAVMMHRAKLENYVKLTYSEQLETGDVVEQFIGLYGDYELWNQSLINKFLHIVKEDWPYVGDSNLAILYDMEHLFDVRVGVDLSKDDFPSTGKERKDLTVQWFKEGSFMESWLPTFAPSNTALVFMRVRDNEGNPSLICKVFIRNS